MGTQEVDLPLPPAALLARFSSLPFAFALDGSGPHSWGSGEAILGFGPKAVLSIDAQGHAEVHACGSGRRETWTGEAFELLDRFHAAQQPATTLVALSYELRHQIEALPSRAVADLRLPVLHAAAYEWVLSFSYADHRYRLRHEGDPTPIRRVLRELAATQAPAAARPRDLHIASSFSASDYLEAVGRVLAHIGAGDLYQVNLAQRFTATAWPGAASYLYATMQGSDPMPFAAYVDAGDFALVSSSPECLIDQRGGMLRTFPIKGTRRRGRDAQEDKAWIEDLRRDEKEKAEHVMIVDLERNDLGKICRTGSVVVEELGRVVTLPRLHHMVSTIRGEARPGTSRADILRAIFPGGSITGAPKIRAMEIIDEIEPVRRHFYTGSIGALDPNGDMTLNIAIRTATIADGRISYHAGGGIVADSNPHSEYAETLLKAGAFFAALGVTQHDDD